MAWLEAKECEANKTALLSYHLGSVVASELVVMKPLSLPDFRKPVTSLN